MINNLTNLKDFDSFLKRSNQELLLMKFSTNWCAPCHRLKAEINKLLLVEKLLVLEIDAEKFFSLSREFEIQKVPTLLLISGEKIKKRKEGFMELEELQQFIRN